MRLELGEQGKGAGGGGWRRWGGGQVDKGSLPVTDLVRWSGWRTARERRVSHGPPREVDVRLASRDMLSFCLTGPWHYPPLAWLTDRQTHRQDTPASTGPSLVPLVCTLVATELSRLLVTWHRQLCPLHSSRPFAHSRKGQTVTDGWERERERERERDDTIFHKSRL